MVSEALAGRVLVVPPQRLDDPGVVLGRETQSPGVAEVGPHVAAGDLPERGNHREETPVGAVLEQGAVPLFVEVDAPVGVAADPGKLAVDISQLGQPVSGDLARKLQRESFQVGQNSTGLPHFRWIESPNTEPPSHVGIQHAFAGQPEQSLANRGPANPQLARHLGIPYTGPGRQVTAGDSVQQLAVDFVPEWGAGDNRSAHRVIVVFCIQYSYGCVKDFPNRSVIMVKRLFPVVVALTLASPPLAAQSEPALREYFEGKTVTVKQAMPGTEEGVDIYPGTEKPLDYPRYAGRLKKYGTALRSGESALITKIRVKSKHIEFQLDGGGYGTMGDETSTNISTAATPQTRREKNLEAEVRRETDPAKKRAIREELDDLKREREREDARNRAAVAEAQEHRKENVRQRRLEGGSRFNIRYRDQLPGSALTPDGVMSALARYVDFGDVQQQAAAPTQGGVGGSTVPWHFPNTPQARPGHPHKGMLLQEADALLGTPVKNAERKEGALKVQTREYATPSGRVTAEFVEGVLIRYTISSD